MIDANTQSEKMKWGAAHNGAEDRGNKEPGGQKQDKEAFPIQNRRFF